MIHCLGQIECFLCLTVHVDSGLCCSSDALVYTAQRMRTKKSDQGDVIAGQA
jgi:hypothetical protein